MPDELESAINASIAGLDGDGASTTTETPTPAADTSAAITPPSETTSEPVAAPVAGEGVVAAPVKDVVAETPEIPAGATTAPEDSLETVKAELAGKRDNRIPYSRVTKIVQNAEAKVKAEYEGRVTELQSKVQTYEAPEFQNSLRALELADQNPEQFIAALIKHDERYAKLLAGKVAPAAPADTGNVDADIQLGDGTLGYSATAVNKLLQSAEARLQAAFDARLKEFEPIREEHQTTQLRSRAAERVRTQLEEAATWPGFSDKQAQADIAAHLKANPKDSLHTAYIKVVVPKLQAAGQADETRIRQQIAEENRKAARASTGVAPGAAAAASTAAIAHAEEDPVKAAIAASIAGLK